MTSFYGKQIKHETLPQHHFAVIVEILKNLKSHFDYNKRLKLSVQRFYVHFMCRNDIPS